MKLSGSDREELLVAFLNEVVFLHETESAGVARISVATAGANGLDAEVAVATPTVTPAGIVVKAATYHDLRVAQRADGSTDVQVYLDV